MEPNKANIRLWVDALRSGKYRQGRQYLETVGKDGVVRHCCLGVACRVAMANGVDEFTTTRGDETVITVFDKHVGVLPLNVRVWLGLDDCDPKLVVDGSVTAIEANDDCNWSFDQIASALEETYL